MNNAWQATAPSGLLEEHPNASTFEYQCLNDSALEWLCSARLHLRPQLLEYL
ncbi:MAG: hypothetical protein ACTH7H_08695 [Cobetia crustatorum]